MLIDWKGPRQTDRTSSLKEGPTWCVVYQEYDRVKNKGVLNNEKSKGNTKMPFAHSNPYAQGIRSRLVCQYIASMKLWTDKQTLR